MSYKEKQKESIKKEIIEMVEKITNEEILKKIYTVVRTHLKILKEKE